jgi:hypothetical protein
MTSFLYQLGLNLYSISGDSNHLVFKSLGLVNGSM